MKASAALVPFLTFLAVCEACSTTSSNGSGPDTGKPAAVPPPDSPGGKIDVDPTAGCPAGYVPKAGTNSAYPIAGQDRAFELLLPAATFTGPRPLLFAFHGTSETGARFIARAKLTEFVDRGFVVVAPNAVGNGKLWPVWDAMRLPTDAEPNKDLEMFDSVLACVAAHHPIDKTRVFAAGHSAGGIMTNRILRSRANVVAGGIVASGVFDFTGPSTPAPDPLLAIVTWGGDNDTYSGTTPNGVTVGGFSFVEQASLATIHYAGQANVAHARCRGANVGHAWLPENAWFAQTLLARPKGTTGPLNMTDAPAICSIAPYTLAPLPQIACPSNATAGCQAACQLLADCAAENRTVGGVMQAQLTQIGISGGSCSTCVTGCAARVANASDTQALSCLQMKQAAATCGPGVSGAMPMFEAINTCCAGRTDSAVCVGVCTSLVSNPAAVALFPTCTAITN